MDGEQDGGVGSKVSPHACKDQLHDHLRNLNVHTSVVLDGVHSRALRGLADGLAKPLSSRYLESPDSQVKSLVTEKMEILYPS